MGSCCNAARDLISLSLHRRRGLRHPPPYIRLSENENLFKYREYYEGTGRPDFGFARSVAEGPENARGAPLVLDLARLMQAFPFDRWK
jgi:pyruvyltransferase